MERDPRYQEQPTEVQKNLIPFAKLGIRGLLDIVGDRLTTALEPYLEPTTISVTNDHTVTVETALAVDASGQALTTVTLPSATGYPGRVITITRTDTDGSKTLVIDAAGTETINGDPTYDFHRIGPVDFVSDGVGWWADEIRYVPVDTWDANNLTYDSNDLTILPIVDVGN